MHPKDRTDAGEIFQIELQPGESCLIFSQQKKSDDPEEEILIGKCIQNDTSADFDEIYYMNVFFMLRGILSMVDTDLDEILDKGIAAAREEGNATGDDAPQEVVEVDENGEPNLKKMIPEGNA